MFLKQLNPITLILVMGLFISNSCSEKNKVSGPSTSTGGRDPLKQPFSESSIWNMPIGSDAVYVPANIELSANNYMTVDEDILLLDNTAPLTSVKFNDAGWNRDKNRCDTDGRFLFSLPIPPDFVYSPDTWDGLTPNAGVAVLMQDGRTIHQSQPFARCLANGPATTQYLFPEVDLYGDGIVGAHGGSSLSCIGGTIRRGELVPGGNIPHAMKMNLYAGKNYYYRSSESDGKSGYRWPAQRADGYASRNTYAGKNPALQMGSLLALKPDFDISQLETEAGQILAAAFKNYGAYLVDDTAWDVYALCTEHSPDGTVREEFQRVWGFDFAGNGTGGWKSDYKLIIENLHVIDNNGPNTVGGGGDPIVPMAAPLSE